MTRLLFALVLSVFTLCYAVGSPVIKIMHPAEGCFCEKFGCGCCLDMVVPQIWLNDTACINFAFDPDAYGISFVFTIDDEALINETISARNPPPICFPVPLIEDFVDICVHFTDLSISNTDFHGCVAIEFRMWWVYVVAEFKLGCFDTNKFTPLCKKHIDEKVIIHKVPVFHNLTVDDKYKYSLVPMLDMMPVNEAENISDSPKEAVNFDLLNLTTVSPKEDINFHLLNVTTVSPKEDVNFHILNTITVSPNRIILVNRTTLKPVFLKVNRTLIPEGLAFCAGSNLIVSYQYLLFLVVLQTTVALNIVKFF